MVSWFSSLWQYITKHRVAIVTVGIILVAVIALIIVGYWFDWTGFNGYYQVTIAHTTSGPSAGTVVRTEVYQPGKALWDWMQLLIIPVAIAVGVWWLNRLQQQRDQKLADERAQAEREAAEKQVQAEREAAEKRAQTERDLALDNQREAALQDYIDNMSELLLEKKLRESGKDDEVRTIARVRTLTVLPRLDGKRKGSVVQFLHESGLIDKNRKIIDLSGADLSSADLSFAELRKADLHSTRLKGANLRYASLTDAELSGTTLREADLSEAFLMGANLHFASLDGANLSKAHLDEANLEEVRLFGAKVTTEQLNQTKSLKDATMPDGSKHA